MKPAEALTIVAAVARRSWNGKLREDVALFSQSA
jgi:hypothetical protein